MFCWCDLALGMCKHLFLCGPLLHLYGHCYFTVIVLWEAFEKLLRTRQVECACRSAWNEQVVAFLSVLKIMLVNLACVHAKKDKSSGCCSRVQHNKQSQALVTSSEHNRFNRQNVKRVLYHSNAAQSISILECTFFFFLLIRAKYLML